MCGDNFLLHDPGSWISLEQGQLFSYLLGVWSSKWTLVETMTGKSSDTKSNRFV
jgi:hypothetical protein